MAEKRIKGSIRGRILSIMENLSWQGGRELAGGETDQLVPPHFYWRSHLFGGFGGSGAPPKRSPRYSVPHREEPVPAEIDRRVFAADIPAAVEVERAVEETPPDLKRAVEEEAKPPPVVKESLPPPPKKSKKKPKPDPFKALPTPPPPIWQKP